MGFDKELKNIVKKKDKNYARTLALGLQWVSVGYSSALYFAGKKIGKEIVAAELKSSDVKGVFKEATQIFKNLGIGNLSVKTVEENRAVLVLKGGTTASKIAPVGKTVCYFEAGMISGILEGRLKKSVTVTETRCGGLGHPEEEFTVKM